MTTKTHRKYILFFISLVIASVAALPVSASEIISNQTPTCFETTHHVMSNSANMNMGVSSDSSCEVKVSCESDQCTDQSCCTLSLGLPVNYDISALSQAPSVFMATAISTPQEPLSLFDRPPIS